MIKLNKNVNKLIIPAIGGWLLTGYLLYNNSSKFGVVEAVVMIVTAIFIIGIILVINKMFSKDV